MPEEVLFKDTHTGAARNNQGFEKNRPCCETAPRQGFSHVWIDTCCIDQTSSAELSEAINSMFGWYKQAKMCQASL